MSKVSVREIWVRIDDLKEARFALMDAVKKLDEQWGGNPHTKAVLNKEIERLDKLIDEAFTYQFEDAEEGGFLKRYEIN
ncbi:hypothetical protein CPT_Mater74 [Bacillus phage Mater]|uniref:Uncharacterized protein n=1 Tax=Bacillus phage Mater TaxID=1540090 RepID=A0A0A0RRX5_9CAUD|nr:hypothetical protein CPT_Mater74 [Bacillus phage Mater]AIW03231.1 hypothetical protein CPT_Mater74 [Bacillus phage Mater]